MVDNPINKIVHLSDIHIRRLYRHQEYREVFNKLYKKLRKIKPDIIYVGGDIVHGKNDLSPELTRMVARFLLRLSRLTDHVIIISGNHDCNLQNKSREDALSPIIDLLKKITSNIYYWKNSGKYTINNIDFGVLSIFDIDKNRNQLIDKLPNPTDMDGEYKIVLHHGPVGTFRYDNQLQVTDDRVTLDVLKGYDFGFFGDIHLKQFLNSEKTFAFCGSLIQQNFSERPSHGFLLWDLKTKTAEYHEIKNDYGFKTIEIIDGKIQNKMDYIPSKGNIRIRHWDTTFEQIKDIQIDLRKQYPKLRDIKSEKQDGILSLVDGQKLNKIDIGDVRDVNYQNELIIDFLKKNVENIDNDTIRRIFKINEITNNTPEIFDFDVSRNISWKLKYFEFDNMFSYKEGNKVDFTKLDGVIGLIGPNHSGKSSLLSALSYTIFDTCDRTFKAIDVLNNRKKKFTTKLNIEVNGEDYWIERVGNLKSRKNRKTGDITHTCPVDVRFYNIREDKKIDLTGASRRTTQYGSGTNEEIRKLLGTFDDFILTSLSLQTNSSDFVDKKQYERKQILFQFMDLNIFDELYDIAKLDSDDERFALKAFRRKDSYAKLARADQKINNLDIDEIDLTKKLQVVNNDIDSLEDKKINLVKDLWRMDEDFIDVKDTKFILQNLKEEIITVQESLNDDKEYKETLRPLYLEYYARIEKFDDDKIKLDYDRSQVLQRDIDRAQGSLEIVLSKFTSENLALQDLKKYKYDPGCSYCLDNAQEHIKRNKELEINLKELKVEEGILFQQITDMESEFKSLQFTLMDKQEYDIFVDELNQISQDALKIGGKISTKKEKVKRLSREIKVSTQKIEKYYEFEQKIKQNQTINDKLTNITDKLNEVEKEQLNLSNHYKKLLSKIAVAKKEKQTLETEIKNLLEIEQKVNDYDLYLAAISKDHIPYDLASKTIPVIESEVNRVLDSMTVGFTLKLTMDGKDINIDICYGEKHWPLELASGMERFISNLAMRVGLVNASNLPRPNLLVIDEGFGTLDGDSLGSLEGVFQYLKTQFDIVLIITHLESVKDYMDHLLPINVNNGYSKIIST